jgi:hypothetical protein
MSDSAGSSDPQIPNDPFVRNAVRAAVHMRRHLPLYAIAGAVLLVAVLVPTVTLSGGRSDSGVLAGGSTLGTNGAANSSGSGPAGSSANGLPLGGGSGTGAVGSGGAAGVTGSGSGAGSGSGGGASGNSGGTASLNQPLGKVQVGSGTTVGGIACRAGLRQIPISAYADPCQAAFTGNNGGATYRGVTATTIKIADRDCPQSADSAAVQAYAQQAGAATQATTDAVENVFLDYFAKIFDLYGRHIVWSKYPVSGGSTQCTLEAESQGQDAACADADGIANSVKAFAEDGEGIYSEGAGGGGSGPFSQCAAQQHLVELEGGAYFPQSWYDQLNPYVWEGIMGCERVAEQTGEALVNQIMGKNAQWAGDPLLQHQKRVLGTYVPNNAGYQQCVHIYDSYLQAHGDSPGYSFNYVLDVSRFADQASQAVVQFHAEGVTTIVLACDPISPVFLTEEADSQHYYPEWYNIGVALNDFDTVPRLWDAKEITGHYFGMSQLGPSQSLVGPQSEPGILYKQITGKTIPQGTNGNYYGLLTIYDMLQAAGPDLTPATMAKGIWALPPGGAAVPGGTPYAYAAGLTCYCTNWQTGGPGEDHTAVEDSREVYWDNTGTSPYDGKAGTFIPIWSGARFRDGEIPKVNPPFYPSGCNPSCTTIPPNQPPPPGAHDGG